MNVLITGGSGFIGSHVCRALLDRGDTVICIDNFDPYYDVSIKETNIKSLSKNKNFKIYRADTRDAEKLKEIFETNQIERIVHLAAKAGVRNSISNPKEYYDVNINGTLNLLELAKQHKIQNFVFASSSSVYGAREKGPFSETDDVNNPLSPYAATKKAGEELCYTYHYLYNIPITCLRFFTVYGPCGRPDMAIYKFTKLISEDKEIIMYGDGTTERDYTYIADIVQGIIAALDNPLNFEIINLGNNTPIKLKYMISLIEKNLNKKAKIKQIPLQKEEVQITFADISKAQELLSYHPITSIEEGIRKFIIWFKNNNLRSTRYQKILHFLKP